MLTTKPQSVGQIVESLSRRPFTEKDFSLMKAHFEANIWKKGYDIELDETLILIPEMLSEGVVCLRSRAIACDIILVNVDAGRGLFGGQKTRVLTYTSDIYRNEYYAGPALSGILRALVGVNNLYRGGNLNH